MSEIVEPPAFQNGEFQLHGLSTRTRKGYAEVRTPGGVHNVLVVNEVQPRPDSTSGGGAEPPSLAVATPWDDGAWALVLPPGADLPSLANAVGRLPTGCQFVEAYGDVETVLVFRFADQERTAHVLADGCAETAGAELRPPAHAGSARRVPRGLLDARAWPAWLPTEHAPDYYHPIVEDLIAEVERGISAIAALGYTLDGGMIP